MEQDFLPHAGAVGPVAPDTQSAQVSSARQGDVLS
jgi:hypothetical protein